MKNNPKIIVRGQDERNPKALLQVIGKSIESGRRYFGSSGASLTKQVWDPAYAESGINPVTAKIGLEGERKTTKILLEWIEDKSNAILIDSIHLPTKEPIEPIEEEDGVRDEGDTDHALVLGHSVILIDSKAWKEKSAYSVEDQTVKRGRKHFPGGRVRMNQARYLWTSYLKPFDVNIYGYVCITNEAFIIRDRNWWRQGFKLINHENIIYWLDKLYNEEIPEVDKQAIDVDLISSIVKGAIKPYDVYKEKLGEDMVRQLL